MEHKSFWKKTQSEIDIGTDEDIKGIDVIRDIPHHEILDLKPQRNSLVDDFKPKINKTLEQQLIIFLSLLVLKLRDLENLIIPQCLSIHMSEQKFKLKLLKS